MTTVDTPVVLLLLRLGVVGVFVAAGLAKLFDHEGTRQALTGFGVSQAWSAPLAIALPIAELLAAIALVPQDTAAFGAMGALALSIVFLAAIVFNLAKGRKPACHCFGQLHSAPIGASTVGLDVALAVVVGFLIWSARDSGWPSFFAWIGELATIERVALLGGAVGLAVLGLVAWMLWEVIRQQGRLLLRLEAIEARLDGPAPATAVDVVPAPAFSLDRIEGGRIALADLVGEGKPTLLVFSNPHCGPCTALVPDLARWQIRHDARLTIAVVSEGSMADNVAKFGDTTLPFVLVQQAREVAEAYDIHGTPAAVLVRTDGTIGAPVATGAEAIQQLVESTMGIEDAQAPAAHRRRPESTATAGLAIGDAAPDLSLPDLDGAMTPVKGLGRPTLLLFWNPECGFCERMLDDLRAWEADTRPSPTLLLVSRGTVEQNRAMGLRATVLLDQDFVVGPAFGAGGTPMAILLDADGRIASTLAAGVDAVFALADTSSAVDDGIVQVQRVRAVAPVLATVGE